MRRSFMSKRFDHAPVRGSGGSFEEEGKTAWGKFGTWANDRPHLFDASLVTGAVGVGAYFLVPSMPAVVGVLGGAALGFGVLGYVAALDRYLI
jgi:hypothetical protein